MCGSTKRIHVHHIKRWANFPSLRYNINNGVCLCKVCHNRITGKEEVYATLLIRRVYFNTHGEWLREEAAISSLEKVSYEDDYDVSPSPKNNKE